MPKLSSSTLLDNWPAAQQMLTKDSLKLPKGSTQKRGSLYSLHACERTSELELV